MKPFIDILTSISSSAKKIKHFLANYKYYSLSGFCNNNTNQDKFLIINYYLKWSQRSSHRKGYCLFVAGGCVRGVCGVNCLVVSWGGRGAAFWFGGYRLILRLLFYRAGIRKRYRWTLNHNYIRVSLPYSEETLSNGQ